MHADRFRHWLRDSHRTPVVMGVLNATPDSFSDGGRFDTVSAAVAHAREMIDAGADMIDIGGESTRPGSLPVDPAEQIRRIVPVIRAITALNLPVTLSVDTTWSAAAREALDAGAHVINDISAGRDDPAILKLAASRKAPIILMHMQGIPATMQNAPVYSDVAAEVIDFLKQRTDAAVSAGVDPDDVLIDPGIGFGKTDAHNLELLRRLREVADAIGKPLVLGTSRKGFIGRITGEADPAHRLFGTAATVAWGIANRAGVLRVHDVKPMAQVTRMIDAILKA